MTLDEAIKHAEEVAEEKENEGKLLCQSECASIGCLTCAEEHRQLAEWLKDYKRLLEQENVLDKIRDEIDAESTKSFKYPNWERAKALEWALEVVDKYREVAE